MNISWLSDQSIEFPKVEEALDEPNGLLAAGGDLSARRLISAYSQGIFPWYDDDQPILWWSPDPRTVLTPNKIHVSKSLKKQIKKSHLRYSFNLAFEEVIGLCGSARKDDEGTWITDEMKEAYIELHHQGYAHSVEIWNAGELVGGLYGIALGKMFYGESMFSLQANTSKIAMLAMGSHLHQCGYKLIDCQVDSDHLFTMGAMLMRRCDFIESMNSLVESKPSEQPWDNKQLTPVTALL